MYISECFKNMKSPPLWREQHVRQITCTLTISEQSKNQATTISSAFEDTFFISFITV